MRSGFESDSDGRGAAEVGVRMVRRRTVWRRDRREIILAGLFG